MKLFSEPIEPKNVLPQDGEAIYYGPIFSDQESDTIFKSLLETIPWKNDEVKLYGTTFVTARKVAWFGDTRRSYTYSGTSRESHPWIPELLEIKKAVEHLCGAAFNSCLLNLYESGEQGLGWHQDDEPEFGHEAVIASVSFGAERRFDFRHIATKETVSVMLEHGSLLVMRGVTQHFWKHQIPKSKKVAGARINLTFRGILK